jgi:hypothetical protein
VDKAREVRKMNSGVLKRRASGFTAPVKLNNLVVMNRPLKSTTPNQKIVQFDGSIETHNANLERASVSKNARPTNSHRAAKNAHKSNKKVTTKSEKALIPTVSKGEMFTNNNGPKPWRFKSKNQRAREKRRKEREAALTKSDKERENQRLVSEGVNGENYVPLCGSFPTLSQSKTVFLRSKNEIGEDRTELAIETRDGAEVATLDYTKLKPTDRNLASGRRILRDSNGQTCAVILHSRNLEGRNTFKICGGRPMSQHHTISSDSGYFTWGEVHNTGELNAQFCLTIRQDAEPQGNIVRFKTKSVGSMYLNCCLRQPRGFSIYHKSEEGKKYDGCGTISFYKDSRGVMVSQNMDYGLMLCYAVIIDEMMERRML